MTTGTIGSLPPGGFLSVGSHFYKTWSGGDGRVEIYGGRHRVKWNNFTADILSRKVTDHRFTAVLQSPSPHFVYSTPSFAAPSLNGTFNSSEINRLLSKLSGKVKNHEFNLAVSLGQMNQTVSLLSSNLSKLGRSILALKRGDFATAARQLGARPRGTRLRPTDISGRWLELQYGWLPLISDSYEACKAFESISKGPRKALFRASISKVINENCSQQPSRYSCIVPCRYKRRIQFELYEEMAAERQLGLYNPAALLWELTPYSFVVDWFIPFGTYLDNLNQIPFLKGRFLTTDVKKADAPLPFIWLDTGDFPGESYPAVIVSTPKVVLKRTKITRTYSTSLTVPFPSFNTMGINSSRRFWNAVSLAHQRFTS